MFDPDFVRPYFSDKEWKEAKIAAVISVCGFIGFVGMLFGMGV